MTVEGVFLHNEMAGRTANAATFDYDVLTTKKVDADGNYGTDAPTNTTKTVQMPPALTATYHLNPSNAEISTDKSQILFPRAQRRLRSRQRH